MKSSIGKGFIWIIIITIAYVAIFSYFSLEVSKLAKSETEEFLNTNSKHIANNADSIIKGHFQTLESIATMLSTYNLNNTDEVLEHLSSLNMLDKFKCFGIVNTKGQGKCYHGFKFSPDHQNYFNLAVSGKTNISEELTDYIDGLPLNIYATPIWVNDKISAVLFATKSTEDLDINLNSSNPTSFGEIHLFNNTGLPLASHPIFGSTGAGNVFDKIDALNLSDDFSSYKMKLDIHYRNAGNFKYTDDDNKEYFVNYTPMETEGLFLLSVVSSEQISKRIAKFRNIERISGFALLAISACTLALFFILDFIRSKSEDKSRMRMEFALDYIQAALMESKNDQYFTIDYVNDAFYKMTGFSKEELEAQFDNRLINMIHPDDLRKTLQSFGEQAKESTFIEAEYRIIKKDGSYVTIYDKSQLHRDKKGNEYYVCTLMDISQRQATDNDILDKNKEKSADKKQTNSSKYKSEIGIFEYLPSEKAILNSEYIVKKYGLPLIIKDVPYSLLQYYVAEENFSDELTKAYNLIGSGQEAVAYLCRMILQNGDEVSLDVTLTNIFNETKEPVRTVGLVQEVDRVSLIKPYL